MAEGDRRRGNVTSRPGKREPRRLRTCWLIADAGAAVSFGCILGQNLNERRAEGPIQYMVANSVR